MVDEPKQTEEEKRKAFENLQQRGTQDEMEIISLILAEAPVLRKRVLDRIRFLRSESKRLGRQLSHNKKEAG